MSENDNKAGGPVSPSNEVWLLWKTEKTAFDSCGADYRFRKALEIATDDEAEKAARRNLYVEKLRHFKVRRVWTIVLKNGWSSLNVMTSGFDELIAYYEKLLKELDDA